MSSVDNWNCGNKNLTIKFTKNVNKLPLCIDKTIVLRVSMTDNLDKIIKNELLNELKKEKFHGYHNICIDDILDTIYRFWPWGYFYHSFSAPNQLPSRIERHFIHRFPFRWNDSTYMVVEYKPKRL